MKVMKTRTLAEHADARTGDGFVLERDDLGRLVLTIDLSGAPPRSLLLLDRQAARGLGRALLGATDDDAGQRPQEGDA